MKTNGRVTVKELSKILGVSAMTITNALTGHPNVSEQKRAEIIKKANELGYKPNLHARAMVKNGIRLGVVWSREPREFNSYFMKGIHEGVERNADYKISVSEHYYRDNRATFEVRDAISATLADGVDGLMLGHSFYTDTYRDMLKDYVMKHDLPLFHYSSQIEDVPCVATIMPNASVTGKMVAQVFRMVLGKGAAVGVITTTPLFAAHQKTVEAFVKYCGNEGLHVTEVLENHDSKIKTYDCARELIEKYPELRAIYVTCFDSSTVCRCIENMGRKGRIFVVGHDIYPEMVEYLMNGSILAAIFNNPILAGRMGVDLFCNYILGNRAACGEVLIDPQLVLRSNLECFKEYLSDSDAP